MACANPPSCVIVLLLAAAIIPCIQGQYTGTPLGPQNYVYASAPTFSQPPVLSSSNGWLNLTLTVDAMTMNAGVVSMNTRGYYYTNTIAAQGTVVSLQAAWPGPTLRLKPGDTLVIQLINKLGANPTALSLDCCGLPDAMPTGMLPTPNTTNLHFHGLATNPDLDSIFIDAPPGGNTTYTIPIPSYHAPGIHWYHAHVHGSVALQVMGGLAGAVYVDPVNATASLPSELNAMPRYLMFLQHLSQTTNNSFNDPFTVRTYPTLATIAASTMPPNFVWSDSTLLYKDIYLVNGQMQPRLTISQSAWTVFDFVNAVGDHIVEIEVRTAVLAGTKTCEIYILAYDGVYLNTAPRVAEFVAIAQGQRVTAAFRCNSTGTLYMQTYGSSTEGTHPNVADTEVKFNQLLVTLTVTASSSTPALPATLANIPRPFYLNDLRSQTPTVTWEDSVEQTGSGIGRLQGHETYWMGIGTNCTLECGGRASCTATDARTATCGYTPFAGMSRGSAFRHVSRMGTVNELMIQGRGKSPHPMHLHTMHVQLQAALGVWGNAGDFRDVVPALAGTTVVRYYTFWPGEVVVHCHYLYHEDHGMMDTIYVQSNATTSNFVSCTYPSNCTVTGLSLPPPAAAPPPAASSPPAGSQQPAPSAVAPRPPPGATGSPPATNGSPSGTPTGAAAAPPPSPAAVATVKLQLTLSGVDYNAVVSDATRLAALKEGVCSAALTSVTASGAKGVTCSVTSVSPGSVVVGVQLTSSDTSSSLQSAANTFTANPAATFSSSFTSQFSIASVNAVVVEDTGSSKPIGAIVGGVVGGVVGLAVLAAIAYVVLKRSSNSHGSTPVPTDDKEHKASPSNGDNTHVRPSQVMPV